MNILEGYTNFEIDARVGRLAKSERKITHLVLCHILEVERRKLYLDFSLTSVFQYLTKRHGYCESSAYMRISAAKLLAQNPKLENKIEDGSIKLSQLAKMQKHVRQKMITHRQELSHAQKHGQNSATPCTSKFENEIILEQLENKTSFETDRILAKAFAQEIAQHQKIIPQSDGSVRIEFSITAEEYPELQKLLSYMSHSNPTAEVGKLMMLLVNAKIRKFEGKRNASELSTDSEISGAPSQNTTNTSVKHPSRSPKTGESKASEDFSTQSFSAKEIFHGVRNRKHLRITLKRRLFRKANNCCEFIDENSLRCRSCYQLQVDHIMPIGKGGRDEEQNMRVLCAIHNRSEASRYGLWKIEEAQSHPR